MIEWENWGRPEERIVIALREIAEQLETLNEHLAPIAQAHEWANMAHAGLKAQQKRREEDSV